MRPQCGVAALEGYYPSGNSGMSDGFLFPDARPPNRARLSYRQANADWINEADSQLSSRPIAAAESRSRSRLAKSSGKYVF